MEVEDFRTPLGRVRGLGSAKHGTGPWWLLRLTSLALVPLGLYFVFDVLGQGQFITDYDATIACLRAPVPAGLIILFLLVGCHHAAHGLQVVIEDYVHCEKLKLLGVVKIKFITALLAFVGTLAVLRILFGA